MNWQRTTQCIHPFQEPASGVWNCKELKSNEPHVETACYVTCVCSETLTLLFIQASCETALSRICKHYEAQELHISWPVLGLHYCQSSFL
eukprot:5826656-Amphidinium_carterae.1